MPVISFRIASHRSRARRTIRTPLGPSSGAFPGPSTPGLEVRARCGPRLMPGPYDGPALVSAEPDRQPAVQGPVRCDRFGDPLPPGALFQLGTVRLRAHSGWIYALAVAPDGKTLASGGYDKGGGDLAIH